MKGIQKDINFVYNLIMNEQYIYAVVCTGLICLCFLIVYGTYSISKFLNSIQRASTALMREIEEKGLKPFQPEVTIQPLLIEKETDVALGKLNTEPESMPELSCSACGMPVKTTPLKSELSDNTALFTYACTVCDAETVSSTPPGSLSC